MTDIYGSTASLESLRSALSSHLRATFELRHSAYRGGDYLIAEPEEGVQYVIQSNYNVTSQEWVYSEYSEATALFFATGGETLLASLLTSLISAGIGLMPLERRDLSAEKKVVTTHWNGSSFS